MGGIGRQRQVEPVRAGVGGRHRGSSSPVQCIKGSPQAVSSQASMRVPDEHPLARTFALLDPDLAPAAAAQLAGATRRTEIEGLVELLLNPEASATACSVALASVEHDCSPLVSDAVVRALTN